jgi:hypothetical protein
MFVPRPALTRLAVSVVAPLALFVAAFSGTSARAEGPVPSPAAANATCEHRGLVQAMHNLALLDGLTDRGEKAPRAFGFEVAKEKVAIIERASGQAVLVVDCAGADIPEARSLRAKSGAVTRPAASRVVSRTALGAASLDLAPGALFPRSLHVLLFDDGSASLSFGPDALGHGGARLLYAVSTNGVGDLVEKVDASIGCGCERWVTADGQRGERPLPATP